MKLTKSASRWGNMYNFRYYLDGVRIEPRYFKALFKEMGFTPENGIMEDKPYGFRKVWEA